MTCLWTPVCAFTFIEELGGVGLGPGPAVADVGSVYRDRPGPPADDQQGDSLSRHDVPVAARQMPFDPSTLQTLQIVGIQRRLFAVPICQCLRHSVEPPRRFGNTGGSAPTIRQGAVNRAGSKHQPSEYNQRQIASTHLWLACTTGDGTL